MNRETVTGPLERIVGRHTPGPWAWINADGMCWQLHGAGRTVVCDDGSAFGEYGPKISPDSPNARLIAAAPDLLDALRNLLAVRRGEGGTKPNADALAEAAIAKALGVPPNTR